jgi:hypothetical protein
MHYQIHTPAKVIEAVRSNLKPYETKAYKTKKAGGGVDTPAEPGQESSAPAAGGEDLI